MIAGADFLLLQASHDSSGLTSCCSRRVMIAGADFLLLQASHDSRC